MVGTQCMAWACGRLGKVPHVRNGIVDGLERCPEYGLGCGWYPMYVMGLFIAWQGTSCTDWECGWFGNVPGVWFGLWSVPSVQIGNVNSLERYLVYEMRLWMT
jgi:hypothetical protein